MIILTKRPSTMGYEEYRRHLREQKAYIDSRVNLPYLLVTSPPLSVLQAQLQDNFKNAKVIKQKGR